MYELSVLNLSPQYEIAITVIHDGDLYVTNEAEPFEVAVEATMGSDLELLAIPLTQLVKGDRGVMGPSGLEMPIDTDFVAYYNDAKQA